MKTTFKPPTIQQVKEFAKQSGHPDFDAEEWWYFYDSKGWKVGKNTMVRWRSAVKLWLCRERKETEQALCGKVCHRCGRQAVSYALDDTQQRYYKCGDYPKCEHIR